MAKKLNYSAGANRGNRVSVKPSKSDARRDRRDLDKLGEYLGLTDEDFDQNSKTKVTLPTVKFLK